MIDDRRTGARDAFEKEKPDYEKAKRLIKAKWPVSTIKYYCGFRSSPMVEKLGRSLGYKIKNGCFVIPEELDN